MPAYIFNRDIKVNSADGIYTAFFLANVPQEVSPTILQDVISAGGVLNEDVKAGTAAIPALGFVSNSPASIDEVVAAMNIIIEQNDKESITGAGMPRANVIEQLLGRATTKEERATAWAQIEG